MENFTLFASPWWVNLLALVPFVLFYFFRGRIKISRKILLATAVFGVVFGFVEAAVVVYLRNILALMTSCLGNADNVFRPLRSFQQFEIISRLPNELMRIEFFREAATIIMLLVIAYIGAKYWRERLAIFFWTFAIWDIFYYAGLWITIKWPPTLTTSDVLFLIPDAWTSQVWFPLLISLLVILSVFFSREKTIR